MEMTTIYWMIGAVIVGPVAVVTLLLVPYAAQIVWKHMGNAGKEALSKSFPGIGQRQAA